jgi:hypothetical protein
MPDEGTDEQGLTARERRRRQVEAEQRKQMPKKVIRYTAILVAIAIAIAGGAWAISKINQLAPSCPLEDQHEHANFYVYDEGQRVRFQHPKFDLSGPGRQAAHAPAGRRATPCRIRLRHHGRPVRLDGRRAT